MNYFDNRLSIAIFNIRFGLALFVIYIHFNILNGFVLLGQPIVFESNWLRFIVITIGEVLARISVPLFFFISGYLFFEGIRKGGSLFYAKNKKRVRSILVPYLSWSIITFLYSVGRGSSLLRVLFPNAKPCSIIEQIIGMYANLNYDWLFQSEPVPPINVPLWFVRDLFVVILCSPIIYFFLKKKRQGYVVLVLMLILWMQTFFPTYLIPGISLVSFLFFSMGAFMKIHNYNPLEVFYDKRYYLLCGFIFLSIIDILVIASPYFPSTINNLVHCFMILSSFIPVLLTVSKIQKTSINTLLSSSSFVLFSLHYLIVHDVAKLILRLCRVEEYVSQFNMCMLYLFVPLITAIICVFVYRIISYDKFATMLFIGRNS